MTELIVNTYFNTVVEGPANTALTDAKLYLNSAESATQVVVSAVPGTNLWSVGFTPVVTGVYSLYGFNKVQIRFQCVEKSMYASLQSIEDEALGSWSWDKSSGILTLLRQNGAALGVYRVTDSTTEASKEKL